MGQEILIIIITTILTSILSFIAFVLSQIYYKGIEQFKTLKAKTSYILIYYANIYGNPVDLAKMPNHQLPEDYIGAANELRTLAADWRAFIEMKPVPGLFIASNRKLADVSGNLIGLSNSLTVPYNSGDSSDRRENVKRRDEIKRLLRLNS